MQRCILYSFVPQTLLNKKDINSRKQKPKIKKKQVNLFGVPKTCIFCCIRVQVKYLKRHLCKEKCPQCDYKGLTRSLERHFKQKCKLAVCRFCAEVLKGGIVRHMKKG